MKKLVVLGHGTGGTIIATKMRQRLHESQWSITVIDKDWQHHYQPGWLFIPFGIYTQEDCVKPKTKFVPPGVNLVLDEILAIDPDKKEVKTKRETFSYDWLVIATGCRIVPEEVPNPGDIVLWANDFYQRPAGHSVPVLQLTYDDSQGLFPWDEGYATPELQPRPGSFAA